MDRGFFVATLAVIAVLWAIWWLDAIVRLGQRGEQEAVAGDVADSAGRRRTEALILGGLALVAWLLTFGIIPEDEIEGPAGQLLIIGAVLTLVGATVFQAMDSLWSLMGLRTLAGIGYAAIALAATAFLPFVDLSNGFTTFVQAAVAVALVGGEAARLAGNLRLSQRVLTPAR
jgi:hypothetical protein